MGHQLDRLPASLAALAVIAVGIVAYAWWLLVLVRQRGERFFLPGFLTGVIGSFIGFAAASPGPLEVGPALGWIAPLGIVGSWCATRSVLRRLRDHRPLTAGSEALLRTGGAYVAGAGLVVVVQVLVLFLRPPVPAARMPSLPSPSSLEASKPK